MKRQLITFLLSILLLPVSIDAKLQTRNVILITLDGIRWQEVFSGADSALIFNKTFTKDSANVVKKFWDESSTQRRQKLMPFFWNEIAIHGQPGFDGKVATFCSWDVFDYILNEERAGFPVNSGMERFEETHGSQKAELLNELIFQIPVPWESVRFDAFTFHYVFDYLKRNKPRLLYIAFDETDEYAHEGKFGQYLKAINALDEYIKNIWDWVQSDDRYKNKTTLIITTDHGRGKDPIDYWRHHGINVEGAEKVWIAVIGSDTPATGEVYNSRT